MATRGSGVGVAIGLLGGFRVSIGGIEVPQDAWRQRARHLVALLALQPDHRLHREQVASCLWPHLDHDAALANLHKAAHLVRRTTDDARSVVLGGGMVELWPDRDIEVDAVAFEARAMQALRSGDAATRRQVAETHGGGFLVEDPYEDWTQAPRTRLRVLRERLVGDRGQPVASERSSERVELVGRTAELGRLHDAMRWAAEGRPTGVVLHGPAGIGKTVLLEALVRDADAAGWAVWRGVTERGAAPYGPLRDALVDLCADHPELVERLTDPERDVLERVMAAVPADPAPRHAVLGALRRLAVVTSDACGLLVAIDDADDLDVATGELLQSLVRATGRPLLVCLACRSVDAGGPLEAVATQLRRSGGEVLDVGPLDHDAAVEVVRRATDGRVVGERAARIHHQAGGTPMLLHAVARLRDDGDETTTPDAAFAAIAAGLAGRDAELAVDLRLVACAGAVPPAALPTLVGSSARADRVVATGALERTGARYCWRTRLLRDAVLAQVPGHRRPALHATVAERLIRADAPASEVARHLLAADRGPLAVPHLARAADAASAVAAWSDALALVETALDHAPGDPSLLARRAHLCFLTGDPGAGIAFGQAAAVADAQTASELRLGQAWALLALGDVAAAEETLARVPAQGAPTTAREATVRSMVACFAGKLDEGQRFADAASTLAHRGGRPDEVIDAAFVSGFVAHSRGQLPDRLRREVLSADGLPRLAGMINDGYLCPAQAWLYSGEPVDEIVAFTGQLRDAAVDVGAQRGQAFATLLHGQALLMAGRLPEAADELSDARELHDTVGAPCGESLALVLLAHLAVATGRQAHADPLLAAAFDAARRSPLTAWHLLPRIHGARILAAADLDTTEARVREAVAALRGPEDRCPACWLALALPGAIASVRIGARELAQQFLDQAEAVIAMRWRRGGWVAGLDEARAWVGHDVGPEAAVTHLQSAAAEFERCGQPHDAARCRDQADTWLSASV